MSRQLHTLFLLNTALQDLDMVQEWIYTARDAAPFNQTVQTRLDIEQAKLNAKKAHILTKMYQIAASN